MNFDWRQIFNFYQRLSPRERTLLVAASVAVLCIGLYSFIWQPLADGRVLMARQIGLKEKQLENIQQTREKYLDLLRQFEASQAVLEKADEKFSLFPHIESTVSQVLGGRDKILSMNPQSKIIGGAYREESVELKLTGISLKELVDMLYQIEKGPHPLRVTRLLVKKRYRDPRTFDVTATVSMLKKGTA